MPRSGNAAKTAASLVFSYVKRVYETGYLSLDLTPEHIRMDPQERRFFLIDFSGYARRRRIRLATWRTSCGSQEN